MPEDRVAIITGAASGMGMALAKHFAAKGWKLALFDINEKTGQELATQLGPSTAFFKVDVSSYASQAAGFLAAHKHFNGIGIHALLANAGIVDRSSLYCLSSHRRRSLEDIPPEPNTACTDIDYKGVLYGVQLATHFMRHNSPKKGGKIVITASVAGYVPHPTYPEYNGAKAGVIVFARGVAEVLKRKENISINVVCPGIVATSIIPPEMVAAVEEKHLTPVATVVRAYDEFLEQDKEGERYGEVVEASVDKVLVLGEHKLANGESSKRAVTVWDPLFEMLHGEKSGLAGAIP